MEERVYNGVIYVRSGPGEPWRNTGRAAPGAQQGVVLPPPPTAQYEAPQAAANVERTQTDIVDTIADNRRADIDLEAKLYERGLRIGDNGQIEEIPNWQQPRGTMSATQLEAQDKEQGRRDRAGIVSSIMGEVMRLYKEDIQGQPASRAFGLAEYLPTPRNERFTTAAQAMLPLIRPMVAQSAKEGDSDREMIIFESYIPKAGDSDLTIESKLRNMERLLRGMVDGALPSQIDLGVNSETPFVDQGLGKDREGNPVMPDMGGAGPTGSGRSPADDMPPSAFDVIRTDGGAGQERKPAEAGSATESLAAPPQMVQEHDQMVAALASQNGGRIDPDQYAAERARLDAKYNRQGNIEDYKGWATSVNDYLDAGGRTIPTGIQDETRVMSMTDTLRNNLVSNPVGAAATGYFNAGGMGALNALAPDQAAALADAYPLSSLGGEIGGAITGTALLGGLARNTVGRAAPRLLGGGARSQTARNIGTDAAYAAGYSANSGDDIATGTALGVGGSAFGQALGKLTGAAVGGLQRTAPAQALMDRGVRLSIGRQLGGGAARAEDLLQSVPFVGGQVRNRQADSFTDFNRAAFEEGAKPLSGFNPTAIGRDGIEQFDLAVSDAYQNALGGRSIPLDPQFTNDLAPSVTSRMELPADVQARADKLIENHLGPIGDTGQITGEAYQRARRGLGKARNNANQIAGEFDQPYRETMTGVLDALDAQLARGGGADIVENLNLANAANKNLRILEDASLDRAKIGTQAGEVEVFTPAQLLAASRASEKKFGGATGLRELGQAGQEVLPSTVPNSGTADRAMAAAALGTTGVGLAGLGAGTGYAIGGQGGVDEGAYTGAGLAAALALLGTRQGQQLVQRALIDRPEGMRRAGRAITARRGLFGSAMQPVVAQD